MKIEKAYAKCIAKSSMDGYVDIYLRPKYRIVIAYNKEVIKGITTYGLSGDITTYYTGNYGTDSELLAYFCDFEEGTK